jgi:ABC-type phosphate transport system substrate-binding protein
MKHIAIVTAVFVFCAGLCVGAPPQLAEKDYPRVDGSTSTLSLQCLIKSAILKKDELVQHSDTGKAYSNLIDGMTDLILVARAPSAEELASAERKGVKLSAKPVALDALVFLVNRDNGIDGLSLDQIRDIYLARTIRWEDLRKPGTPTGPIEAYTRERGSGSEELARSLVLRHDHPFFIERGNRTGNPFSDTGETTVIRGMGGSMRNIANKQLSLTYSVFFYVKHVGRLLEIKEGALEDLRKRHAAALKTLDESDLKKRDTALWADLRKRADDRFRQDEEAAVKGITDIKKGATSASNVRMIAVNGVEPNEGNIGLRKYPLAAEVYVAIKADQPANSPAVVLRDWLLSPEGQEVVAKSGYVKYAARRHSAEGSAGITAENVAKSVGDNQWRWTIYVKGAQKDIDRIKCVEYSLHPTFRNPVRKVCERGEPTQPFSLTATGWGTFPVGIKILMKDGRNMELKHQLKF